MTQLSLLDSEHKCPMCAHSLKGVLSLHEGIYSCSSCKADIPEIYIQRPGDECKNVDCLDGYTSPCNVINCLDRI
jgi:hypothetical protein